MTTPAHCTRTDPHPAHEDRSDLDIRMPTRCAGIPACERTDPHHPHPMGFESCPGVEPPADVAADRSERERLRARRRAEIGTQAAVLFGPADVQATPDPRLDEHIRLTPATLAQMFYETYERLAPDYGYRTREASAKPWDEVPEGNRLLMIATAAEILDVLDDLAGVQTMHEPDEDDCDADAYHQEIRGWMEFGARIANEAIRRVSVVEHGDDETPDDGHWGRTVGALRELVTKLTAERDLAEARLGHMEAIVRRVEDIIRDHPDAELRPALRDALAWTPGITDAFHAATANVGFTLSQPDDTATGGPHGITLEQMRAAHDTATAGAATGDGDGD